MIEIHIWFVFSSLMINTVFRCFSFEKINILLSFSFTLGSPKAGRCHRRFFTYSGRSERNQRGRRHSAVVLAAAICERCPAGGPAGGERGWNRGCGGHDHHQILQIGAVLVHGRPALCFCRLRPAAGGAIVHWQSGRSQPIGNLSGYFKT